MALWQWTGLAVAAALLCMVVRQQQPEMASLCALAAGVMLLVSALEAPGSSRIFAGWLPQRAAPGVFEHAAEGAGIAYTAELASQTCADLGRTAWP